MDNFQKTRWDKLFRQDLIKLFNDYKFSHCGVEITMKPNSSFIKNISMRPDKNKKTPVMPLFVDINVSMKDNKETDVQNLQFNDYKLCDIPVLTDMGFYNEGSLKRVISTLEPASGWYTATPSLGFFRNDFNVFFRFNSSRVFNATANRFNCSIFVFLKACTGLSYNELLNFFKPIKELDFRHLFGKEEPTVEQASEEVLRVLNGTDFEKRSAYINITNAQDRLKDTLYTNSYGRAGLDKIRRFAHLQTYHRFIDYKIVEVLSGNVDLAKGTNIDRKVANYLDSIGTLEVVLEDSKGQHIVSKTIKSCLDDTSEVHKQLSPKEILYAFYNIFINFTIPTGVIDDPSSNDNNIVLPLDAIIKRCINKILYSMTVNFTSKIEECYVLQYRTSQSVAPASFLTERFLRDCLKSNDKLLSDIPGYLFKLDNTHQAKITNSVSDYEQFYRVNKSVTTRANKDVQSSDIGKLCDYTTPESDKAGVNVSLCANSALDECGFILSPFYKVTNGVVDKTHKIYLNYLDTLNHYIAPFNLDLSKLKPQDLVEHCTLNSEGVYCLVEEIAYQRCNADDTISVSLSYPAFIHQDAGKRLTMAVSEVNQASAVVKPERCLISTGFDRKDVGIYRASDLVELYFREKGDTLRESIPKDLKLTIIKVNTSKVAVSGYMTLSIEITPTVNEVSHFDLELRCTSRSSEKTFLKNSIKPPQNGKFYNCNEIVIYANDIDLTKINLNTNNCHFNANEIEKIKDHGIALGQNVKVLFKIFGGYGYEDSVQVNRRFVEQNMGLNTFYTIEVQQNNFSNKDIIFTNVFQSSTPSADCLHLDRHGLPKVGVRLHPGDIVIGRVDKSAVLSDGSTGKFKPIRLKSKESGVVIRCNYNEDPNTHRVEVSVTLLSILDIQKGDKITGLHGNKSVVSRIIDDADMPYLADGTTPDIIFNPLGCMARENVGQLSESIMIAMAEKNKEVCICEPFTDTDLTNQISKAEKIGVEPQTLYNPKTGEPYPEKAFIGQLYLVRNTNIANSKYKATGTALDAINPNTLQPNRQDRGGQRVSEMTAWCYKSLGLDTVLDTFFTLHSDDLVNFNKLKNQIDNGTIYGDGEDLDARRSKLGDYESLNQDRLQSAFRFLGMNIICDSHGLTIKPLNSQTIIDTTAVEVKPTDKQLKSTYEINLPELVYPSKYSEDTLKPDYVKATRRLYGRIDVGFDMIMPIFMANSKFLTMFLNYNITLKKSQDKKLSISASNVKPLTIDLLRKIINREVKFGIIKEANNYGVTPYYKNVIVTIPTSTTSFMLKDVEAPLSPEEVFGCEFKTNIKNFFEMIKTDYNLDEVRAHLRNILNANEMSINDIRDIVEKDNKEDKEVDEVEQILHKGEKDEYHVEEINETETEEENTDSTASESQKKIKTHDSILMNCLLNMDIFRDNYTLDDYFTHYIVVAPNIFRPLSKGNNGSNKLYETSLGAATHNIWIYLISTQNNTNKDAVCDEIYSRICNCCRFQVNKKYSESFDIIKMLTDHSKKKSIIRDTNAAKRVRFSARSVISVDPTLKMGEAGIPLMILETIFEEHLIGYYTRKIKSSDVMDSSILSNIPSNLSSSTQITLLKRLLYKIARNQYNAVTNRYSGTTETSTSIIKKFNDCKQELISVLENIVAKYPVMLSRDPALHRFSIAGFKIKPVDGYALTISPLSCKGFNADFDGDQMSAIVPQEYNAIKQVADSGMFGLNLINPRDTESIIQYGHEMVVGLYNATLKEPTDNVKKVYAIEPYTSVKYNDFKATYLETLYDDYEMGLLSIDDTVIAVYKNRQYKTTLGKLMFNSLFKQEEVFTTEKEESGTYKLLYNEVLTNKALKALTREVIYSYELSEIKKENENNENEAMYYNDDIIDIANIKNETANIFSKFEKRREFLNLLDRIMSFSFYIADNTGLTLSVWDLASVGSDTVNALRDKGKIKSRILATYNQLGFINAQSTNAYNIDLWKNLTKESEEYMSAQMKSDKVSSNLRSMINSGARGSARNLNNICGIVGIVKDAQHALISSPITSNYFHGLSDIEAHENSYTARESLIMAQNSSAVVGENTRQMVYQVEAEAVSNSGDTCNDETGIKFNLYYDIIKLSINDYKFDFNKKTSASLEPNVSKFLSLAEKYGYERFSESLNSYDNYINRLASLLRVKKVPVITTENKEEVLEITYKMDKESHDFIVYRVFEPDSVEFSRKELAENCWTYSPDSSINIINSDETWYVSNDKTTRFFDESIVPYVNIHTMLHCKNHNPCCARCYGYDYSKPYPIQSKRGIYKTLEEANSDTIHIGYTASQSIAEPMAQGMLDTHKNLDKVANGDGDNIDLYSENSKYVVTEPSLLNMGVSLQININKNNNLFVGTDGTVLELDTLKLNFGTIAASDCTAKVYCGSLKTSFGKVLSTCILIIADSTICLATNNIDVIVYDGQQLSKGDALVRRPVINEYYSFNDIELEPQGKLQLWREMWRTLNKQESLMPRHIECFAKAMTELGIAVKDGVVKDETGNEIKIHQGLLYPIKLLQDIPYEPHLSTRNECLGRSRRPVTALSKQHFKRYAFDAVFEGVYSDVNSDITQSVIGNYATMKSSVLMGHEGDKPVFQPRKIQNDIDYKVTTNNETKSEMEQGINTLDMLLRNKRKPRRSRPERVANKIERNHQADVSSVVNDTINVNDLDLFGNNAVLTENFKK